jgi:hypothetical protein
MGESAKMTIRMEDNDNDSVEVEWPHDGSNALTGSSKSRDSCVPSHLGSNADLDDAVYG